MFSDSMAQAGGSTEHASSRLSALRRAFQRTLPIVLGYLPVGFAYGVLAQKTGLSTLNSVAMSVLVFAGSAQLIAVGLFAGGAGAASVIVTTFIVNLRHLLMSAALAPYVRAWTKKEQAVFAFQLTDETFALHASRFPQQPPVKSEAFEVNVIAQSAWIGGSVLGVLASGLIADVKPIGLDYALPAMFIALLVAQVDSWAKLLAGVTAGAVSVGLVLAGVEQMNVIVATVVAASIGLGVESWISTRSS